MIFQDFDFGLEVSNSFKLQSFELIFSFADVSVTQDISSLILAIEFLLVLKLLFPFIEGFLIGVDLIHEGRKLFADSVDVLISVGDGFGNFLPLGEENVSLVVLFFEFFSGFVEFDLTGLGGRDFLVELLLFSGDFESEFFDLEVELSDFGVIFFSVFLEDDVVLLFLFTSDGPLFEFLLVPVEFEFDLFDFFVGPEDSDLNVIESLLIFGDNFVMFFDLVFKSATLSFGDLPEVVLGFGFFVFLVDEALGVEEFLVDVPQMFFENFLSLEISFIFFVDFFDDSALFFDELVELFIFVIGKFWDVIFIFGVLTDWFWFFFFVILLVLFIFVLFVVVVVVL